MTFHEAINLVKKSSALNVRDCLPAPLRTTQPSFGFQDSGAIARRMSPWSPSIISYPAYDPSCKRRPGFRPHLLRCQDDGCRCDCTANNRTHDTDIASAHVRGGMANSGTAVLILFNAIFLPIAQFCTIVALFSSAG
jgi:hypothetical protein